PQSEDAPPSPNTLSTASTPPGKNRKVLPMCPVQIVTYLSGRSTQTIEITEKSGWLAALSFETRMISRPRAVSARYQLHQVGGKVSSRRRIIHIDLRSDE
ncbi:hypothetical protein RFN29_04830, partial [Mesorhizobium sp. VK22B]